MTQQASDILYPEAHAAVPLDLKAYEIAAASMSGRFTITTVNVG